LSVVTTAPVPLARGNDWPTAIGTYTRSNIITVVAFVRDHVLGRESINEALGFDNVVTLSTCEFERDGLGLARNSDVDFRAESATRPS
jgi:hypothetical protein